MAERLAGENLRRERPFTGRVNMFAAVNGLIVVDADAIARINRLDEAITVATLAAHRPVAAGDMAATVKIIPFAAPGAALIAACEAVGPRGAVWVAPFRPLRVGVVSTLLPGLKASVIAKTLRVLEARLAKSSAAIGREERVAHEEGALAAAIERLAPHSDALVIFGASAITDRRDVIPRAIEASGGRIEHFGMPVDPGNLLLLAERGGRPDHRRSRLRALAQGERIRLGARPHPGRRAHHERRHQGDGRRRPVDGDRLATATAARR